LKQTQNKKARHDGGLGEFVRSANSTCPPVQKPSVGQEAKEKSEIIAIHCGQLEGPSPLRILVKLNGVK
jgi:hypothetical protein